MIITNQTTGNDSYTKLLIQSNNANGSTTFTDLSGSVNMITGYGGIAHSTSQYKNGKSSIYFDGIDDYLSIPDFAGLNFGISDFTIEFFYYPTLLNTYHDIINQQDYKTATAHDDTSWLFIISQTGIYADYIDFTVSEDGDLNNFISLKSLSPLSENQWYHIAGVRRNDNISLYVNGKKQSESSISFSLHNSSLPVMIGRHSGIDGGGTMIKGYLDQICIKKGISKYNGNFTPPARMW